jgi:hypothetical protein
MDVVATVSRSRAACLTASDLHRRASATCEASMQLCQTAVGLRRRVRFAIGGGSGNRDIPVSESAIRAQLRRLVEDGILPRGTPKAVGAGRSQGRRRCTGCSVHFQPGDIEYEIITDEMVSLVLHRRCIELWTELVLDRSRPAIHGGQDPVGSPANIRTRLLGLIDRGALPAVMPRRMFIGPCRETHPCIACGMDITTGAQEFEWTNPGNLILFFHRRCAEIYMTLNDGHGGG